MDSAKALLTLGRMLPKVEVLSQEEVDDEGGVSQCHTSQLLLVLFVWG